ncbi:MAG: hypothetical protein OEU26_11940 [Candidatus Tectomicrobia bacterium]|nr:hypothetical protein [Candidatus Tectomicrobia bacterium]
MTYDVILRKKQNKYVARVRDWPEVIIEGDSREAAITEVKALLSAYLSHPSEIIQIDLEPNASEQHPWLQFAGMWSDDPTWDEFEAEVKSYRQETDNPDTEA